MFRSPSRLVGYLLPIALAGLFLPVEASAQKTRETFAYAPPSLGLSSDTSIVTACDGATLVKLNARASSPDGNPIRYRWFASAGRIDGSGPTVNWDLSGLAPGVYKAFINIETGNNASECNAFTSTTVVVRTCPPVKPVCPTAEIICPTDIAVDQPLTFGSNISGGNSGVAPVYNWSVSAGTITDGQGTPTIRVDTTGLAGQTVKATLTMAGYPMDCSASCAVSIPIPGAKCRKFDEFPDISRNDEKARLDNYGIELQHDPTATAYIIVYRGRTRKPGDVQRHTTRIVDYLVNSRGIDARRMVTLVGGIREELMVEIWTCPQGALPPNR